MLERFLFLFFIGPGVTAGVALELTLPFTLFP